jgi:PKD repeat protein
MRKTLAAFVLASTLWAGCDSGDPEEPANQNPSAAFTISPAEPRAGTPTTFSANAADPDGEISSYSWDFNGDGNQDASGPNPTYVFERSGSVSVRLTVTDDDGATDQAVQTLSVAQQFDQADVKRITVTAMRFTDGGGAGWDLTSGPDVYAAAFALPSEENLSVTGTVDNIAPGNLPLVLNSGAFSIDDLSARYAVAIYDEDNLDADDFIGGIEFDLSSLVDEYPETFVLDAGAGTAFELDLEWSLSGDGVHQGSGVVLRVKPTDLPAVALSASPASFDLSPSDRQ